METDRRDARRRVLTGLLPIVFYAAHGVHLVRLGLAPDLFWSCHLACLLVAAGILLERPALPAVGLLWLVVGLPLWFWALTTGTGFHPTSTLTHVGGLVVAAVAVRRSGFPRGSWWRAMAGLALLWGISRAFLPDDTNVNLARDFWFGWEGRVLTYPVFLALVAALLTAVFLALERLIRLKPPPPRSR